MTTTTTSTAAAESVAHGARMRNQLPIFVAIGIASSLGYVVIYAALRGVAPAYVANTVALVLTAVANTAANSRLTFGAHQVESADRLKQQVKGGVAVLLGLAVTNGALAVLHAAARTAPHWVELSVLMVANLVATAARFLLMRVWVFRPRPAAAR